MTDLAQPGPYAIGLVDRSFTRQLPDGQVRAVQTNIRYPARKQDTGPSSVTGPVNYSLGPPAEGGPFPFIVFSHGSGASPFDYTVIATHLASHGFVVASPYHEDCRAPCSEQGRATDEAHRPVDVSMVVDHLLSRNDDDDLPFRALVDPGRIGVAGHSFGGWTALTVLERDARVRAGLAMSPGIVNRPARDPGLVSKPLMLMAGVLDAMVPYSSTARFFADIPSSAPDHYLLVVQQAGHQFHDRCIQGFVTVGCSASMPQKELQAIENRVATAFLLRYVAGSRVVDAQFGAHDANGVYSLVKAPADGPPVVPTARPLQTPAAGFSNLIVSAE